MVSPVLTFDSLGPCLAGESLVTFSVTWGGMVDLIVIALNFSIKKCWH